MEKRKTSVRYSPEVRERAARTVLDHAQEHVSQWEAIASIAPKIGCTAEDRLHDGDVARLGAAGGARSWLVSRAEREE